ncbi:glycosyltransferase [Oligoflexus tunisiensis]|uniref:glycosyltransferase n=1 Tax=Oligoflexus tunisiensis TaxID=708132 RepID=UPI00114D004A|nr:glycosyltransferase family 2 protein [Oligoflexus tunisiensis]
MIPGLLGVLGLVLLIVRMWPRPFHPCMVEPDSWPLVSIIVTVCNDEKKIGRLLDSLCSLDYLHYEVIVVDDSSADDTLVIARRHKVRLIRGTRRPEGWNAQAWACYQGAQAARGSYLLFTHVNTVHHTTSLRRVMYELLHGRAQGLSALPEYELPRIWTRLCGPFHVLLLALTNPYGKPRSGQTFASGSYLLLERSIYDRIGGHIRVWADGVDNTPLVEAVLTEGGRWKVYTGPTVFSLRLDESLADFIRGWRRHIRAGFAFRSWSTPFEITLLFAAATGEGRWKEPDGWFIMLMTWFVLWRAQKNLGPFSLWGLLFLPFSLVLFCSVSMLGLWDRLLKRLLFWKKQVYPAPAVESP